MIVSGALLLAAATLGCSHEALTLFFDGVPEPGSEEAAAALAAREAELATQEESAPKISGSSHKPLEEHDCRACHQRGSLKLTLKADELCMKCHKDVAADLRFVHGPVAVASCLYCHHPHGSKELHLLREPPGELCISCHDPGDLGAGEHHDPAAEVSCTECHSGHGGDDPFFLK